MLRSITSPRFVGGSFIVGTVALVGAGHAGCSGDSTTSSTTTATGSGGATSSGSSTSSGGSGGATTASTSTTSSTSSTTAGTGGTGGSTISTGGTGGTGTGSTSTGWPTCDVPEPGAVQKTIHEVWADNPSQPTHVWVPGVYVTAVSKGACQAGTACQIYVQQDLTYADVAAGSQQAIKLFVSANTAQYFTGIQVGQRVDVDAHAWRYNLMGQNELLLQINLQLRGCAKPVGSGVPLPAPAMLSELMFADYDQVGPLLVRVQMVSGKPQSATETFGLFVTNVFIDGGPSNVVSLSPYFLPGGAFTGITQWTQTHDFASVTGVFGVFVPTSSPTSKYREIYPRSEADYPITGVQP